MKLELRAVRPVETYRALDAVGRAQLSACGLRYDGLDLPPERRLYDPFEDCDTEEEVEALAASAADDEQNWYGRRVSKADVYVDGVHAFDLWRYHVDSGLLFRAGTDEVVGQIVQFRVRPEGDDASFVGPLQAAIDAPA